MTKLPIALAITAACLTATALAQPEAEATYQDIQKTLGSVPTFLRAFPEEGIAAAWDELKSIQLNPHSALDGATKELIGLAVASQIPCDYCVYFHTQIGKLNGASERDVKEAIAMAAITRHWSTVLNGMQIDLATFKGETDAVLRAAGEKSKTTGMK